MTAEECFTLIDDGRAVMLTAAVDDGGVRLAAAELEARLGWALPPSRLDAIDLGELAETLGRPLALDVAERCAYLGVAAAERAAALASLSAPDFSLPDLSGRVHSLSEQRGTKVLLVAYASW